MKSSSALFTARSIRPIWTTNILAFLLSFAGSLQESSARATQVDQNPPVNLKQLSLEQLGDVKVTTDAVLLDVQLGNEDGLSLAIWMRQQPSFSGTPVIAVTAHAMVTEMQLQRLRLKAGRFQIA